MGNISPSVLVSLFLITLLCCGQTQGAALTIEPNSSTFYVGESFTFYCDMNAGKDTDWKYRLIRKDEEIFDYQSDKRFRVKSLNTRHSGEYQCCRRWRNTSHGRKCSNTVNVTVTADKPRAKLTAGSTTIPEGGSVTLICSVEPPAGWKYRWFRRTKNTAEDQLTNKENGDITVRQEGIYRCEGERGNPAFYSHSSHEKTIEITFSNKVVVTQQPNWPQMFSGETITLTCDVQGGETTEWTCEWKRDGSMIPGTHSKDWTFIVSESSSGDYMCQCKRGDDSFSSTQWSEAISLSVSADKPRAKLTAGSTTIPVGGSVTLSCSVEPSAGWKYRWFRRTSDTSVEFSKNFKENGDITVTQGGIYRCEGERGNPAFYSKQSHDVTIEMMFSNQVVVTRQPNSSQMFSGETITLTCEVQGGETTEWTCEWKRDESIIPGTHSKDWTFIVSESSSGDYMCQCRRRDDWFSSTQWSEAITVTVSSSFPVLLIVGPLIGIVLIILIILLLLLWRCRRSKGLSCIRLFQSESSSQRPTTDHDVNQTERDYSSLLHGTTSVYEMIHDRGATGNNQVIKERPPDPAEGSVYVNVRPDNYS